MSFILPSIFRHACAWLVRISSGVSKQQWLCLEHHELCAPAHESSIEPSCTVSVDLTAQAHVKAPQNLLVSHALGRDASDDH